MAQIELAQVSKIYGGIRAVDSATLTMKEGEFFSLLGPSGSGKTTILRLVAGFVRPDEGIIRIGDRVVNHIPPHKRNIGMVFQQYALFPHRTVFENIAFGLELRGVDKNEIRRRVGEALEMVQLVGRSAAYPRQLSGGQQQRVAIARSIAIRPSLLLLDEPLSALDRKLRTDMQIELRTLQKQLKITTLYVTHDQDEALSMSDRVAIMNGGKIVQQGTAQELYDRPQTSFVANFLGSANLLNATLRKSNGGWCAFIDGFELPVHVDGGFEEQQPVKLALRPERLAILNGQDVSTPPELVTIPARVSALVYLGSDIRVVLSTVGGTSITARINVDGGGGLTKFKEGDEVRVAWRPREAIIVPD